LDPGYVSLGVRESSTPTDAAPRVRALLGASPSGSRRAPPARLQRRSHAGVRLRRRLRARAAPWRRMAARCRGRIRADGALEHGPGGAPTSPMHTPAAATRTSTPSATCPTTCSRRSAATAGTCTGACATRPEPAPPRGGGIRPRPAAHGHIVHNGCMGDATPPRPSPPPLGDDCALFHDVDGTLVEFQEDPAAVHLLPDVREAIGRLSRRLHGALALVSGRPLAQLD